MKAIEQMHIPFTPIQRRVVESQTNLLFFGRSGTGKTMSSVYSLISRHLTADAIAKKLKSSDANKQQKGLKSIFITASGLLAKEVKAQYETTLKRCETANNKEVAVPLTEEMIYNELVQANIRVKELPRSFYDTDIQYPLFLSHHEFVSILYTTMVEGSAEFKHLGDRVKLEVNDEDKIIERRIAELMKQIFVHSDKVNKALKIMPKRRGRVANAAQAKRQIDFRTFYNDFYKKKISRDNKFCKISSNVAWSEIRTKIKGSSFKYFEKSQGLRYNPNDAALKNFVKTHYRSL